MAIVIPAELFTNTGSASRKFVAYAQRKDMDAAFDDAARAASGLDPSDPAAWIDYASAADVKEQDSPPMVFDAALGAAKGHLAADLEPGSIMAFPIASPSSFTRTRVQVVYDTTALLLPPAPSVLLAGDLKVADAFNLLAGMAVLPEGASPARVELKSARRRFKPIVEVNRGPSAASYAVMRGDLVIASDLPNASTARRLAVDTLKAMEVTDLELPVLKVVRISMRQTGPFVQVTRTLLSQKGRAAVFAYTPKPAPVKLAGWLFAGKA